MQFAIQSFLANAISFSSEKIEASYRCRSISKVVIEEVDLLTVQSWIHSSVECAKTTVKLSVATEEQIQLAEAASHAHSESRLSEL